MFKYGYVTHTNQRGLYKLDLANMRYTRSIDLTPYNCVPRQIQFSALCKQSVHCIQYVRYTRSIAQVPHNCHGRYSCLFCVGRVNSLYTECALHCKYCPGTTQLSWQIQSSVLCKFSLFSVYRMCATQQYHPDITDTITWSFQVVSSLHM